MKLAYRPLLFFLFGLCALFVQGSVLKLIYPGIIVPNLLLIAVVYLSFFDVSISGALISFALGILADFGSGILLGPWAGAFVGVYGMLSALSQRFFIESPVPALVAVAMASILADLLYMLLMIEAKGSCGVGLSEVIIQSILTGLCAAPVLAILKKLFGTRRTGDREY